MTEWPKISFIISNMINKLSAQEQQVFRDTRYPIQNKILNSLLLRSKIFAKLLFVEFSITRTTCSGHGHIFLQALHPQIGKNLHRQPKSLNHRLVWFGRDLEDYLVQIPLPWAGTHSTTTRVSSSEGKTSRAQK